MSTSQTRTPAGSPDGGQFSATSGAESDGSLPSSRASEAAALLRSLTPEDFDVVAREFIQPAYAPADDGNIRCVLSTVAMDTDLSDDPIIPAPSAFGGDATIEVDCSDLSLPMTLFRFPDGTAGFVERDTTHGVFVYLSQVGEEPADDTISEHGEFLGSSNLLSHDLAPALASWAVSVHRRVEILESAIRWASVRATSERVASLATE